MKQVVDFVETEPAATERRYVPTKFQFRKDRGWVWVQRACFWLLRKLKCYAFEDVVTYRRIRVDTRTFMETLHRQHASLLSFYHQRGERLLIGSEEFSKLMEETTSTFHPFTFTAAYHASVNSKQLELYGMVVTVVPWMKGLLVVPKELR